MLWEKVIWNFILRKSHTLLRKLQQSIPCPQIITMLSTEHSVLCYINLFYTYMYYLLYTFFNLFQSKNEDCGKNYLTLYNAISNSLQSAIIKLKHYKTVLDRNSSLHKYVHYTIIARTFLLDSHQNLWETHSWGAHKCCSPL